MGNGMNTTNRHRTPNPKSRPEHSNKGSNLSPPDL